MFQAPFILYMVYCILYMEVTVDFLPYMEVTVGKKKKRQNMAKWGGHQNSKNSNFRDSYLNIEKEFHYTVKDFFAELFKGNNISKINFLWENPFNIQIDNGSESL